MFAYFLCLHAMKKAGLETEQGCPWPLQCDIIPLTHIHTHTHKGWRCEGASAQGSPLAVQGNLQLLPSGKALHVCARRAEVQERKTENW